MRQCFSLVGTEIGLQLPWASLPAGGFLSSSTCVVASCARLSTSPIGAATTTSARLESPDRQGSPRHLGVFWGADFEMPAAASGLRVVRGRQPTPSERADDEGVSGAPSSTANTALVNRQGRRKRSKVGARSADRPGSDRRLRACCPGSMRGQLGRGRYRLGRRPVSPRDGAARVEAQCTVRPAQAGAAEEWWPASAARGDQAWLKRSAWEADGARAQACAACRLHVHARSSRRSRMKSEENKPRDDE